MRPSKAHFVTTSQQLLALGAVLAVLTPAATVVSLDVITTPGQAPRGGSSAPADRTGQDRAGGPVGTERAGRSATARVPEAPVRAKVREVALTPEEPRAQDEQPDAEPPSGRRTRPERRRTSPAPEPAPLQITSRPQPVTGYGGVGVTWSHEEQVADDAILLEVRTATDGTWGDWSDLEYHDDHAPDPDSAEGLGTRPGTDLLFVGEVDRVQLRATSEAGLPDGMTLAVVDPGDPGRTTVEAPAEGGDDGSLEDAGTVDGAGDQDAIELQAASTGAPKPRIFTREQWGANERLRDGRPSYGTISAGFVHHTVNANDYTRAEVPGMLRSIYAYHTQSRGWSDIGYNFLVDKFGRIWEGRYGGVARPVIGAHTLGYNEASFAMSAIGNYETARPSRSMLKAYGALFAWKLGLAGIDPTDRTRRVNGDMFAAINGHRDAGSTACPGRYLYAQLPAIRRFAANATDGPPPEPEPKPIVLKQVDTDLASTSHPDLVVRRASDGRGFVLPTGGLSSLGAPQTVVRTGWAGRNVVATPDLTGDGRSDAVVLDDRGRLEVRRGPASDGFERVDRVARAFRGHDLVTSAGDLDDDGRADLVARRGDRLVGFLQAASGRFAPLAQAAPVGDYRQLAGAGDVTGDGRPDLWGLDDQGQVWLHPGRGDGRFDARTPVALDVAVEGQVNRLVGGVDLTSDRVPDLLVRTDGGSLRVLPARGDGTLAAPTGPLGNGTGLGSLTSAGNLTGSSAPDLLAVGSRGALVVVPHRGTFDLGRPINTGRSFDGADLLLNAGDFDGDGHGDVVMRGAVGSLWLFRGRGDGTLTAPRWIGGKRPFRNVTGLRVVGDVTGDKRPDLVGRLDGAMSVWAGRGASRLPAPQPILVAPDTRRAGVDLSPYDWVIATSDLRNRGVGDLVVRDSTGRLLRLDGTSSGYGAGRNLGEVDGYDLAG